MNFKRFGSLALSLVLCSSLLTVASVHAEKVASAVTKSQAEAAGFGLGDLQTIEVHSIERHDFSTEREALPPEIVEYARTAIQNDERLRYASPGQGVLHFFCDTAQCGRIRVELTYGEDGPILWKTVRQYRPIVVLADPDPRKFAKTLVGSLAADYEKAMKEVPGKIQIKED